MDNIPRRCSVTGAGLSVTKAGLHTHIPPNATKRDGKNKTISCVKTYKTDRLGTTYRLLETKHEKEQKPLVLSHNPEVVGSSPTPATIKPSDFESNQTVFSISSSKKLRLVFQPLRLTHTLTHTRQKRGPDTALPRPDLALSQDIFRVRLPAPSPWLSPPLSVRPWSHGRRCPG